MCQSGALRCNVVNWRNVEFVCATHCLACPTIGSWLKPSHPLFQYSGSSPDTPIDLSSREAHIRRAAPTLQFRRRADVR